MLGSGGSESEFGRESGHLRATEARLSYPPGVGLRYSPASHFEEPILFEGRFFLYGFFLYGEFARWDVLDGR